MRSKIVKMFEQSKGFKTLVRNPTDKEVKEPTVATGLHSNTMQSHAQVENKETLVISGNKVRGYTLARHINGVEKDSHTFPNLEIVKNIINQGDFKNMEISFRVSNEDEAFLKGIESKPTQPEEPPLDLNFGVSNLLNQRDSGTKTYVSQQEKSSAMGEVVKKVKEKLMDKKALVKEIKGLKNSKVIDNVSSEFMNGHVFKDGIDEYANIVRYVHYLVYDALVDYFLVNSETRILRSQSDIRKRGGNVSPTIKDIAKEILPTFERYLNRKEKSELFNAFVEVKV